MIQVKILVEGQTEEAFVADLLAPHLRRFGVEVSAHNQEGVAVFTKTARTARLYLKNKSIQYVTTMFDLYALPKDYPGLSEIADGDTAYAKVQKVQQAMDAQLGNECFFSYIQLHEFEALLLSEPAQFRTFFLNHEETIASLTTMCNGYESPELINDSPETAPSKRIIDLIPSYDDYKPVAGPTIAQAIGLDLMREKCPHFDQWLSRLESLNTPQTS